MVEIINGKEISLKIRKNLQSGLQSTGLKAGLAVILVGEDSASKVYVSAKEKAAKEIGIKSIIHKLPATTAKNDLIALIHQLNADSSINGILVQLPLPEGLHKDESEILEEITPKKDSDGLHPVNMGKLILGQEPYAYSCTPAGIMELIHSTGVEVKGKNAVVIGRSNIVGKPIAQLLMREHATVTICHSRTKDIKFFTKAADIVVVAIGKAKFFTKDMVKEGAIVIDVGMNRLASGLVGDVDFENVKDLCSYITPVPGGVGPMTIAMLMKNCIEAAKRGND